ncbi:MAG TPA: RidA family protein [Bryobacteraceae bacterium]|nr:RidA family protein [Bryobacteraceae bacterium]
MRALLLIAAAVVCATGADLKPVFPKNAAKPIGPYSPGISAGAYFYVSGQGARDAAGKLPATTEEQTRQCLQNVKDILEAAGLGMENVVWAQVFAQDLKQLAALDKVYASFFAKDPPARSMVVVNKMPGDTPVEIAVVAVRDLKQRKAISVGPLTGPVSNAVRVGDRVYISGVLGLDAQNKVPTQPREQVNVLVAQMKAVLAKSGLEMRDMAYAHVYVDGAMPMKVLGDVLTELLPSEVARSVTQTAGIPRGAHIEISGVASTKSKREGACTSVEDTIYCPSVAGTIDRALSRVKENLNIAKVDLTRVVVSNVFLDDLQHFAAMNKTYAGAFGSWLPTRVTLQPTAQAVELNLAPGTNSPVPPSDAPRAQISVIAVR